MTVHLGKKLEWLAGKLEATPGTYETVAAADFDVRIFNLEVSPLEIDMDDEGAKDATGNHAETIALAGAKSASINFSVRCNWGGAVATEPKWWKFAKACGAGSKVYTTAGVSLVGRTQYDGVTISFVYGVTELGGAAPVTTLYKFKGCMGDMTIGADGIGKPWMAKFAFKGALSAVIDGTALVLTAPDASGSEMFALNTIAINSVAKRCSKFSFSTGNDIQPIIDQLDGSGYLHYAVVGRKPRISIDPLAVKQATQDIHAVVTAETTYPIAIATSAATPHFTLSGISCQLMPPKMVAREGLMAWDSTYRCLANGVTGALIEATLTVEDTWELLQGAKA
jgi:hypothetical protein